MRNALNEFLMTNLQYKSKLMFLTCVSPSPKDKKKNRDALDFAADLRNMIIEKGEKKLIKVQS